MPRARVSAVYVGIRKHVVAVDRRTGAELWRTRLPAKYAASAPLVNVVRDAEGLFATCAGELFAIDPKSGQLLWHEPLAGMGTGLTTVATDLGGTSQLPVLIESARQTAAAAAAAG